MLSLGAAQDTFTVDIQAEVQNVCEIVSTGDVDFGNLVTGTQANYDSNGTVVWRCSSPTVGIVALDGGTTTGDMLNRNMENANGSQLRYQLYALQRGVYVWGDGRVTPGTYRLQWISFNLNNPRTLQVLGRVTDADLENAEIGNYTDVVTATLEF